MKIQVTKNWALLCPCHMPSKKTKPQSTHKEKAPTPFGGQPSLRHQPWQQRWRERATPCPPSPAWYEQEPAGPGGRAESSSLAPSPHQPHSPAQLACPPHRWPHRECGRHQGGCPNRRRRPRALSSQQKGSREVTGTEPATSQLHGALRHNPVLFCFSCFNF